MLERLEAHGVDVTDLDPYDEVAMRRALAERGRNVGPAPPTGRMPVPRRHRTKAELMVPMGPPPEDEEASRAAIAEAVAGLAPDDDSPRARWIDRGELLDRYVTDEPRTPPPMVTGPVSFTLVDVVFLRDDEAYISFEIDFGNTVTLDGRAVRREGRWLVSYDTAAGLMQMGGTEVPPAAGPVDEDRSGTDEDGDEGDPEVP